MAHGRQSQCESLLGVGHLLSFFRSDAFLAMRSRNARDRKLSRSEIDLSSYTTFKFRQSVLQKFTRPNKTNLMIQRCVHLVA
jgi:hypothetical protein